MFKYKQNDPVLCIRNLQGCKDCVSYMKLCISNLASVFGERR